MAWNQGGFPRRVIQYTEACEDAEGAINCHKRLAGLSDYAGSRINYMVRDGVDFYELQAFFEVNNDLNVSDLPDGYRFVTIPTRDIASVLFQLTPIQKGKVNDPYVDIGI